MACVQIARRKQRMGVNISFGFVRGATFESSVIEGHVIITSDVIVGRSLVHNSKIVICSLILHSLGKTRSKWTYKGLLLLRYLPPIAVKTWMWLSHKVSIHKLQIARFAGKLSHLRFQAITRSVLLLFCGALYCKPLTYNKRQCSIARHCIWENAFELNVHIVL